MSKAFKAWFKTQTFIPQGDYSYAEMAWDAAVEATKEKAAKVVDGVLGENNVSAAIRSIK